MKLTNGSLQARIGGTIDTVRVFGDKVSWTRGVIDRIQIVRDQSLGNRYVDVVLASREIYHGPDDWRLETVAGVSCFQPLLGYIPIIEMIPLSAKISFEENFTTFSGDTWRHSLSFPGRPSVSALVWRNPATGAMATNMASASSVEKLREAGYVA